MTNPAQPSPRIVHGGQDLVIDSRVIMNRRSLHYLTTTSAELAAADFIERSTHGERTQAITVLISCAMDQAAEGEQGEAWQYLRAAVVVARRIDAARSEGRPA